MKKTYQTIITTITTTLLLGLGAVSIAENAQAADPFQKFRNNNCVPEAKKVNLSQADAVQLCNCTVQKLREQYSTQAFANIYNQYVSGDSTARRTLSRYGETCFQTVFGDDIWEK